MPQECVGLIGTGLMGEPMARNLMKAGYALIVHSRTKSRAERLLSEGASWANTPAELAGSVNTIISIVTDSPDVEAVYLSEGGVCQALRSGAMAIDMSTVSPETARTVDAAVRVRGGQFIDAPVSGGVNGAIEGRLSIMCGGEATAVQQAMPLFEAMGRSIVHCGPVGNGQLTKLCNQILCGLNLLAVSEALVLARRAGLDPTLMLKAVSGGAAGSWAVDHLGTRMVARDFRPMFMINLQQKDLRIALDIARGMQVPLEGTALVHQLLGANQAHGEGREGTQALVKTLERLANLDATATG
jgi:3-hydroxyisobutyrate dehydrogenase